MLNAEDTGSMENLFEIRRYQIDIENEQVRLMYIQTCQLESLHFAFLRPSPLRGRTMQLRRSPITTSLTFQRSTPTTTEGIQP